MNLYTRQLVWRASLMLRRAGRERRRRLVREIADYRTTSERDDLFAAIERCPSAGREEIRHLLVRATLHAEAERSPFRART
jgi:hypothetical protein